MDVAIGALRRAIYYLDRELAPGQKVRAFQRAIDVVAELPDGELEERVAGGTLTDLDGIGSSTGSVIATAVTGEPNTYLEALEERSRIDLAEGAEIRAALRGDCHAHSTWSDGGASVMDMALTAQALGHDYLVMTDHSPRLTIAHGLSEERLASQLDEIAQLNLQFDSFQILTGLEVDILVDGRLDLSDEMLERLDIVVASVHSKMRLPASEMTQRMVLAIANPHVDILGHMTNRKVSGGGRKPSEFDADMVFAACSNFDTAVEINCRPERQDPPDELLALAVEWDCRLAIDTDAHAPGQLEWQAYGCDKAARHDVDPERIVNTMPADDLIAWAASHPVA
jgi:putative hydrolase